MAKGKIPPPSHKSIMDRHCKGVRDIFDDYRSQRVGG